MIDNNVHTYQVLFKVIMNIKMLNLKDLVNYASASGEGKIDILILHTSGTLLMYMLNFYQEVKSFKNGDNLVG